MNNKLLEVKNLSVTLNNGKQLLSNVSFYLKHNQCLGIVGESGSGKSLTCKAIIGLLESYFSVQGQILFSPKNTQFKDDLLKQRNEILRNIRGNSIAIILQHPMSAFDPLYRIGHQIIETIQSHQAINYKDATAKTLIMIEEMGLDQPNLIFDKYPHQLSGGMLQRIMIGIALLLKPDLIIADEPTTALDSITQFHILKTFEKIKQQSKTALIFISHDLGVIRHIADHIVVMNQGCVVEQGEKHNVFPNPQNEHTRHLINARQQLLDKFNSALNIQVKPKQESHTNAASITS